MKSKNIIAKSKEEATNSVKNVATELYELEERILFDGAGVVAADVSDTGGGESSDSVSIPPPPVDNKSSSTNKTQQASSQDSQESENVANAEQNSESAENSAEQNTNNSSDSEQQARAENTDTEQVQDESDTLDNSQDNDTQNEQASEAVESEIPGNEASGQDNADQPDTEVDESESNANSTDNANNEDETQLGDSQEQIPPTRVVFVDASIHNHQVLIDDIIANVENNDNGAQNADDIGSVVNSANLDNVDDNLSESTDQSDEAQALDSELSEDEQAQANQNEAQESEITSYQVDDLLIVVLDPQTDEIQQITETLAEFSGLASVHIISHGSAGQIRLGQTTINSQNLNQHEEQIASWGDSLSDSGDLLLYGCFITENGGGSEFIEQISELTGADVAASDNETGTLNGADWVLETQTGTIEAKVVVNGDTVDWQGVLATVDNPHYYGPFCEGLDLMIIIDESGSIDDTEEQDVREGLIALLQGLVGSNSRVAMVEFNTDSSQVTLNGSDSDYVDITVDSLQLGGEIYDYLFRKVDSAITTTGQAYGDTGGYTNWEAAFQESVDLQTTHGVADITIFFTDGEPNQSRSGGSNHLGNAIDDADALKSLGTNLFTYGVSVPTDSIKVNYSDIEAIMDPNALTSFDTHDHNGFGNIGEADYYAGTDSSGNAVDGTLPTNFEDIADLMGDIFAFCEQHIEVEKTVSNVQPAASGTDGNFDVTIEFTIANNGHHRFTEDIHLVDDFATNFGDAFVQIIPDSLSVTNINAFTFLPFTDINDNYIDNVNDDNNLGSSESMLDGAGKLDPGESFKVSITVEIDPDSNISTYNLITGENNGAIENSAVVTGGFDPDPTNPDDDITDTDTSDDPNDPTDDDPDKDGNPDDPTDIYLPDITVFKEFQSRAENANDNVEITYILTLKNTGNTVLEDVTLIDDFQTQFGDAFVGIVDKDLSDDITVTDAASLGTASISGNSNYSGGPTENMLANGATLGIGDSFTVELVVEVDFNDPNANIISGQLINQAVGTGTTNGVNMIDPDTQENVTTLTVTDLSDDRTDNTQSDPNNDNDPDDPTIVTPLPQIGVVKTQIDAVANGQNFDVTYEITVKNTGLTPLQNIKLIEDLDSHFGHVFLGATAISQASITGSTANSDPTINTAWDGTSETNLFTGNDGQLDGEQTVTLQITITVDPRLLAQSQELENQVEVSGENVHDPSIIVTDVSDDGVDPDSTNPGEPGDHGTADDPTPLDISNIAIVKSVSELTENGDNWDVEFTLKVQNTGTTDLSSLNLSEDILNQFGSENVVAITAPTIDATAMATPANAPSINSSWNTDTTLNMLDGNGVMDNGDSFTITFTVTLDPDASGTSKGEFENQAKIIASNVDDNTDIVEDLSDDGVNPLTSNPGFPGDSGGFDDPTPVVIPDISVVKDQVATVANGDNFDVTYRLTVENIGTVELMDITLIEDLNAHFDDAFVAVVGTPTIISSSLSTDAIEPGVNNNWDGGLTGNTNLFDSTASRLDPGDSITLEIKVTVDPDVSGSYEALYNQVTATGIDPDNNTTSDQSDSGTDPNGTNPDDPGDNNTSDDPTPLLIPDLRIAKTQTGVVENGENFDVTFNLVIENIGTATVTNLTLSEDVKSQFGAAFVAASVPVINATSVTAGTAPGINTNWNTDNSLNLLDGTGELVQGDSFEISFVITVDPNANNDPQVLFNQAVISGVDVEDPNSSTSDESDDGVDPTGTNPGERGDLGTEDDPTPVVIADISVVKQVTNVENSGDNFAVTYSIKTQNVGTVDLETLQLTEDLEAHFGSSFISVIDAPVIVASDLASTAVLPSLNSDWDGTSNENGLFDSSSGMLTPGDSVTVKITVLVSATNTTLENQVVVSGNDTFDPTITASDLSDSGVDTQGSNPGAPGDTGSTDDPTPLNLPDISIVKVQTQVEENGENFDVTFNLVIENTGNVDLNNLNLIEDVASEFGTSFISSNQPQIDNSGVVNGSAPGINDNWVNDSSLNLFDGTGELAVGDRVEITFTVTLDPDFDGESTYLDNQAKITASDVDDVDLIVTDLSDDGVDVNGTNPNEPGDTGGSDDPTPVSIADISIVKGDTNIQLATNSATVTYQLVVENTGTLDVENIQITDDIASQFANDFISIASAPAIVSTTASENPNVNDQWVGDDSNITSGGLLKPGESFTIEFQTIVVRGAASSSLANQATVDATSIPLGNNDPDPVNDISDAGLDPNSTNPDRPEDTGGPDDPTVVNIPGNPPEPELEVSLIPPVVDIPVLTTPNNPPEDPFGGVDLITLLGTNDPFTNSDDVQNESTENEPEQTEAILRHDIYDNLIDVKHTYYGSNLSIYIDPTVNQELFVIDTLYGGGVEVEKIKYEGLTENQFKIVNDKLNGQNTEVLVDQFEAFEVNETQAIAALDTAPIPSVPDLEQLEIETAIADAQIEDDEQSIDNEAVVDTQQTTNPVDESLSLSPADEQSSDSQIDDALTDVQPDDQIPTVGDDALSDVQADDQNPTVGDDSLTDLQSSQQTQGIEDESLAALFKANDALQQEIDSFAERTS